MTSTALTIFRTVGGKKSIYRRAWKRMDIYGNSGKGNISPALSCTAISGSTRQGKGCTYQRAKSALISVIEME